MISRITHIVLLTFIFTIGKSQTIDADTLKPFTKEVNAAYSIQKIEPIIVQEINGQNLGEILRNMSPNFIKVNGPGGIATISLRGGAASQTQIFWEGIAINSPTLGQMDLSLLPSEYFTGVSINHTGASAQQALGGIAGSLLVNSSNHYSYGGNVHFEKEMGSFGLDNTSAKVSLASNSRLFSETVLFRKSSLNNFSYHNYSDITKLVVTRENGAFSQIGAQQNLQLKVKNGWLKMVANYTDTDRGIPVAIGVQGQDQYLLDRNYRSTIQYKTSKSVQDSGEEYRAFFHRASLGFVHDYQNYRNLSSSILSNYITTNISAQFHSRFELKKTLTLETKIDEYYYIANSSGFSNSVNQNRLSASIIGSKKWSRSFINISLQELLIDNELSPINGSIGGYFLFDLASQKQRVFGNLGTNYRYPTLNDLYWNIGGNQNLLPERSVNFEIGLKNHGSHSNQLIEYSFTYFNDYIHNWIQWIPNESGLWFPENVKSVKKNGIEALLQFRKRSNSGKYIIMTSSYRWVDAIVANSIISENEVGKKLIYTPNHIVNLDGTVHLKRWYSRYNQTITSKFFLDRDNKTYLPYSAPADLTIGYDFKETKPENLTNLKASVTIHNIWGEEYQIVANQPMPGRWFSIKLTFNFLNTSFGRKIK